MVAIYYHFYGEKKDNTELGIRFVCHHFKNSCRDTDAGGLEPRHPYFDPDVPLGGGLKRQCSGVENVLDLVRLRLI